MSKYGKSKSEMKQFYLIRRLVAVLVIILILVAIFTRCTSNKGKDKETNTNTKTQVNNNIKNMDYEPETNVNNAGNQALPNTGENDNTGDSIEEVLLANKEEMQTEYDEYATITYENDAENDKHTFFLTLKGDSKNLVLGRNEEENSDKFKQFWENFKFDLIRTSEDLAETVKPGIEIHVMDPDDNTNPLLLLKDGAEIFDKTQN